MAKLKLQSKLRIPKIGESTGYSNLPDRYRMSAERELLKPLLPTTRSFRTVNPASINPIKIARPAQYQFGGVVEEPGIAQVHQGERILTPEEQAQSILPPVRTGQLSPGDNSNIPSVNLSTSVPQDDFIEHLRTLLENPPTKQDYKPTTGRRVLSALAGGLTGFAQGPKAGEEAGQSVYYAPFNQQYQDWLTQTGALEKGVGLETGRIGAENRGLTALAAITNAAGRINPELQGQIAGAKATAQEGAKTTPDIKNFKFLEGLPTEDQKAFKDYLQTKQRPGIQRSTAVQLSVKDAQEQQIPLSDINGQPIDTSKFPINMEFRMITGGPNGAYWVPSTQTTVGFTAGNITSRVPALTPQAPKVSGVQKPPSTNIHEEAAVSAEGEPIAQKLASTTTVATPGSAVVQPSPAVGATSPQQQNQLQVTPPVTSPTTQSIPKVVPPGQIGPITQNQGGGNLNTTRQLPGFKSEELKRQQQYAVPAAAAMTQIVGTEDDPNVESLATFAHLADNQHSRENVGKVVRLIAEGLASSGEGGETIGGQLGAYGASFSGGGIWQWLKNKTTITDHIASAQNEVIEKAVKELTPEEDRFVSKIFAAYGDISAFRSILRGSAYKWAAEAMLREMPVPGLTNVKDQQSYNNKLAAFLNSINDGLKSASVSNRLLPQQAYWDRRTKEITALGVGKGPETAPENKRYTVRKIQ